MLRLIIEAGHISCHWRLLVEAVRMRILRLRDAVSVRSGDRLRIVIVIRNHEDIVIRLILIGGRVEDDSFLGDLGVESGHARPLSGVSLRPQRVNEAVEAVRPRLG